MEIKKTETYKPGDLVWIPSDETFNVVTNVENDESKNSVVYYTNNEKKYSEKELYSSLSDVFERNKKYLDAVISVLQNKNTNLREYYEFLRLANDIISNNGSIFFKTLKRAYRNGMNFGDGQVVWNIDERYKEKVFVDFKKEREKILKIIKNLINSVNTDKIKEIIRAYEETNSSNVSQIFKSIKQLFKINVYTNEINEEIEIKTGIKDLNMKIKTFFEDIFIENLFKNFSIKNMKYLSYLYSQIDFFNMDYKKYAEKIDLKTMILFLGNIRKNYKLMNENELISNEYKRNCQNLLEKIYEIFTPQLLYYVLKNNTKEELIKNANFLIKSMKEEIHSLPERYQKASELFTVSELKSSFYSYENSPVDSLKILYQSQNKNFTYGEKLFILNFLFSAGIFADKITAEFYKQTVFEIIEILDSKEQEELLKNKNLEIEEFYAFISMYNLCGTNISYFIKDYPFETALKKHYSIIKESSEVIKKVKEFIDSKKINFITNFLPHLNMMERNKDIRKEQIPIINKKIENSLKYINSLFSLANSNEKTIDNLKNIAKEWKEIKGLKATEILDRDGPNLGYVLSRSGFIYLAQINVSLLVFFIKGKFIEAKEKRAIDFKKKILLNGMNGLIEYFESDDYKPVDTKNFILKSSHNGYSSQGINNLEEITDENDFLIKKGIFDFIKEFALGENESKWLFSLNNAKISLILLSTGKFFNITKEEKYYDVLSNLDESENLKKIFLNKTPGKFESSLFNYSITFAVTNIGRSVFINYPNYECRLLETGNFMVDAIIVRNYILYTLSDVNNIVYANTLKLLEGKESYEIFESFFNKADISFLKSLKKAGQDKKSVYYLKRMLEDLKEIFWKRTYKEKKYNFDIPIGEETNKYKLYQSKLLTPLYSIIKNIFLNGITVYGEKEQNFIKESFFKKRVVNKWFDKSKLYENVFVKGGLLAVLYKTEGENGLKELLNNTYTSKILNKNDLAKSLKSLSKNFAVQPSGIPASEFKKNKSLVAKIMSGERLFGIEKEDETKDENLINKIKISDYQGIVLIKKEMENNGITFNKNKKRKDNELSK